MAITFKRTHILILIIFALSAQAQENIDTASPWLDPQLPYQITSAQQILDYINNATTDIFMMKASITSEFLEQALISALNRDLNVTIITAERTINTNNLIANGAFVKRYASIPTGMLLIDFRILIASGVLDNGTVSDTQVADISPVQDTFMNSLRVAFQGADTY